ncbi:MAG TPA: hypothetical protein PLT76_05310 [Candidatus Omnitrophota bacterium]|nr:hypothetical protein [Candidatus Omnitrophota bacterium]HQO58120.1 hypothetical protein [Candidatus Omnitrophota bacterium]
MKSVLGSRNSALPGVLAGVVSLQGKSSFTGGRTVNYYPPSPKTADRPVDEKAIDS